jgi:hypothetical protein
MTLTTLNMKVSYPGTGAQTVFPYAFRVFNTTDLVVTETVTATNVTTTLVLNTDYTVSGVGLYAGGNVTRTVATAVGTTIEIKRVVPLTQPTDIRNQGAFFASVHEDAFDRLTMIQQQQQDTVGRALTLPDPSTGISSTLPIPAANMLLGWDPTGTFIVNSLGPTTPFDTVVPLMDGVAANGTRTTIVRGDHVHPSDTSRAPLASPAFTGTPTAPSPAVNTNTTQVETTAGMVAQLAAPTRKVPAGLPALALTLVAIDGVGQIDIYPNDAIMASKLYEPGLWNTGVYYVKPSTGSDSNAGTTAAAPFATVDKAFRTAAGNASRVVMLENAVIPPFDLRSTDASQSTQQFKWLDANGYKVTIRVTGPDLTTQTWAQDGVQTNCWHSTLTVSGSQAPKRILRMDQLDRYGYYQELINYSSAANLNAAPGDGWWWDGTSVLWVKIGAGTNVQNQRAILKGLYCDTNGNFRVLCYGSSLGMSGVTLEGVQFVQLDQNSRRPEIWLHQCQSFWAADKGADLTTAGWFVATECLFYSSRNDCVNAFAPSATGPGLIHTARCNFVRAGNFDIFPLDGTIQGTSAHGGSSHVGWANNYFENNGQQVADTCINSSNDITWLVACSAKGGALGPLSPNYLFGSAATSASRKAYLDTCASFAPGNNAAGAAEYDLEVDANATAYTFNSALPYTTGTAPTTYASPLTPP